ncbi:hypothetical protein NC652_004893 [Populus alba x Populus x berolinensis]|nr:hypothetical protein NC652_004893 [Populus alba x Populus x berolinensis]
MLVTTRNSLELLSSILKAETEPKPIKQVISQYEELEAGIKSREQLPESSDNTGASMLPAQLGHQNETKIADYPIGADMLAAQGGRQIETKITDSQLGHQNETKIADYPRYRPLKIPIEHHDKTKTADSHKGESTESSSAKKIDEGEFSAFPRYGTALWWREDCCSAAIAILHPLTPPYYLRNGEQVEKKTSYGIYIWTNTFNFKCETL